VIARLARLRGAWRDLVTAVREDHAMLHHTDGKYAADRHDGSASVARDLVTRAGFQMLAACRFMQFCAHAQIPLAPKVASRMIRHLYGSDVHWEAEIEPGVVVVHGMGIAVSRAARVQRGAILFQNVTLGMGTDPSTRAVGAPTLERDVHVGPGSTLVGPITVGAGSKVTANCFVRASVPPQSLVEAPTPSVTVRSRAQASPRNEVGT
jgi:serine O-acetyltransferase